jgi:hypothetical protein
MVKGIRESGASALSFGIVLTALVSMDERVRGRFWSLFEDPSGGALSPLGSRISDLGSVLWEAARDQSIDNAPLLVFTAVGVVLVAFMLRT